MRPADRTSFDFHTGVWVREDPTTPREAFELASALPYTEPAAGRWSKPAVPPRSDERLVALIVWATIALVIAAIVLRSFLPFAVGAVPLTLFTTIHASRKAREFSVTEADRRLLEDPDDRDVCLVHLTVVQGEREIGRDKGVAWFSHGALLYNGHRTSFVLGGEDVLPRESWSIYTRPDGTGGVADTVIPLRKGRMSIRLTPLVDGKLGSAREMRFLKSLYDFKRRPPVARIPRQWPPLEP